MFQHITSVARYSRMLRLALLIPFLLIMASVFASDHADPVIVKGMDSNITGLFVFPEGDQLIVILGIHPGLTTAPPYDLEPFTYNIHMDLHSSIDLSDKQSLARYGGHIVKPEAISPDVILQLRLNNDTSLKQKTVTGLNNAIDIQYWSGVRDDPFIFPRFFGTNIIAVVARIPLAAFPDGQDDWVLWATSSRDDEQIDHVGRSLRTMLPRFDFLNTLPPRQHVAAIKKQHEAPGLLQDIARNKIMPLFAIRQYDFVPDVMIYTKRRPPGFPNGRRLTDDVAALTCKRGDCLLWELSFANTKQWPRQTVNDKPFLTSFPYLAEPWPVKVVAPKPGLTTRSKMILTAIIVLLLTLFVLPWALYLRCRH